MAVQLMVPCGCGCGELFVPFDGRGRAREFIRGHWSRVQPNQRATVNCETCGAPIVRPQWHLKKVEHHFCNATCEGIRARMLGIRRGERNGHYNTITVPCAGCSEPVSKAASLINRRSRRVYCPTCIPLYARAGRKGFYVGYPKEFNDTLREQIRERDGHTCQLCGVGQEEAGHTLQVHHIDYTRTNNDPMNLITLCNVCHGRTNYAMDQWQERLSLLMRERFAA